MQRLDHCRVILETCRHSGFQREATSAELVRRKSLISDGHGVSCKRPASGLADCCVEPLQHRHNQLCIATM